VEKIGWNQHDRRACRFDRYSVLYRSCYRCGGIF